MCDLYWIWISFISNKHPMDKPTQGTSCLSFPLLLFINDLGWHTSHNLIYRKLHYDNNDCQGEYHRTTNFDILRC